MGLNETIPTTVLIYCKAPNLWIERCLSGREGTIRSSLGTHVEVSSITPALKGSGGPLPVFKRETEAREVQEALLSPCTIVMRTEIMTLEPRSHHNQNSACHSPDLVITLVLGWGMVILGLPRSHISGSSRTQQLSQLPHPHVGQHTGEDTHRGVSDNDNGVTVAAGV
jgi:hypothetical protein